MKINSNEIIDFDVVSESEIKKRLNQIKTNWNEDYELDTFNYVIIHNQNYDDVKINGATVDYLLE